MRKVVITGASGAIGRALITAAINAGYEVLAVVHRSSPRTAGLEKTAHCRVLRLDLSEYDNAIDEMKKQGFEPAGYSFFFHLAWMAPFGKDRENLDLQLENVRAALAAVRFAKAIGCSCFIGTGSQAEYGRVDGVLTPETPAFPETGYGCAKLCASQMTRLACEQSGMRHIWCRVLSVYGPYDREQTLISTAVRQMLQNEATEFTPCEQMWDYLYSQDAAEAILLAAEKGSHGEVFVVGSGEARPLKDYIEEIARLTAYKQKIGFGSRPYNEKQVMHLQADITGLKNLGFQPRYTFEEGIRSLIDFMRGQDE